MKPLKTKVSITLDSTVVETIRELADNDDRSFSQFINLILKDYLSQKELFGETKNLWFYRIFMFLDLLPEDFCDIFFIPKKFILCVGTATIGVVVVY